MAQEKKTNKRADNLDIWTSLKKEDPPPPTSAVTSTSDRPSRSNPRGPSLRCPAGPKSSDTCSSLTIGSLSPLPSPGTGDRQRARLSSLRPRSNTVLLAPVPLPDRCYFARRVSACCPSSVKILSPNRSHPPRPQPRARTHDRKNEVR
jgi:hypothetical protein